MKTIPWEHFAEIDIRSGTIVAAEPFPEARVPAYKLTVDFGALGTRRSSAQITLRYRPEELVGRQVLAVVNFPPKRVAGFNSEVLVLGTIGPENDIVLLRPDLKVENGLPVG